MWHMQFEELRYPEASGEQCENSFIVFFIETSIKKQIRHNETMTNFRKSAEVHSLMDTTKNSKRAELLPPSWPFLWGSWMQITGHSLHSFRPDPVGQFLGSTWAWKGNLMLPSNRHKQNLPCFPWWPCSWSHTKAKLVSWHTLGLVSVGSVPFGQPQCQWPLWFSKTNQQIIGHGSVDQRSKWRLFHSSCRHGRAEGSYNYSYFVFTKTLYLRCVDHPPSLALKI